MEKPARRRLATLTTSGLIHDLCSVLPRSLRVECILQTQIDIPIPQIFRPVFLS